MGVRESNSFTVSRFTAWVVGSLLLVLVAAVAVLATIMVTTSDSSTNTSDATAAQPTATPPGTEVPLSEPSEGPKATDTYLDMRSVRQLCLNSGIYEATTLELSENQTSLTVHLQPGWSIDMSEKFTCVPDLLDAPDSVLERMEGTRALDGTLDAAWGDYTVTWTYHPDDGLRAVYSSSES